MKTTKLIAGFVLATLFIIQVSCSKEETVSPYAAMHGTYSGDIAITGDKTDAGTTNVSVNVDGNNVRLSFTYGDYPVDIALSVTEVQEDKDILYQIPQQSITVNGNTIDIVGYELATNVHGTFNDTTKKLAFAFTYTGNSEVLKFYFIGDKN